MTTETKYTVVVMADNAHIIAEFELDLPAALRLIEIMVKHRYTVFVREADENSAKNGLKKEQV